MIWLKANECQFSDRTFSCAVRNGNQENMKWLKSNGCGFSEPNFVLPVFE